MYDGMGCAYLAMLSAGLEIEEYNAFEIDKYAVKTSQHNFPKIKHHGDVTTADFTQFKDVDYLMGGSPCTYWSIAQSPDKRETVASGIGWELFSHYVRALKECKPKHFIYENNKSMSDSIKQSISDAFGFEPICINSALVSAQNRQRLYWCGIRNEDGTYSKVEIEQPQDKGILLRDILESVTNEPVNTTTDGKSQTLKAQYPKNNESNFCCYTSTYGASGVAEPIRIPPYGNTNKSRVVEASYSKHAGTGEGSLKQRMFSDNPNKQQVDLIAEPIKYCNEKNMEHLMRPFGSKGAITSHETDKSPTLIAAMGTGGGNGVYTAEPIRIGTMPNSNGETSNSQGMRIYSVDGKSVNLTSGDGGMGAKTGLYAVTTNKPIYEVKDGQITIKEKQYPIKLKDGYYIIRKLTVNECKRLQTVPEWYEFPVSDSQAYKMLGNGWTVDVIAHLIKACERGETAPKQLSFF